MFSQKLFDDISAKISEVIAASPAKDVEKNVRAMMTATFTRLDLVTREEFEVQQEVLARTREQLDQALTRLDKLEQALVTQPFSEATNASQQDKL